LPESNAQWRESVMKQVRKLVDQFQREIDENPNEASPYNQWAWLVSNTEGDFQKAIRYSHRSLELNTHGESGAASFLDTLGRCYYAAGDYKSAVKYERKAMEKNDYLQVMRRQLALFEKALADQSQSVKQLKSPR
jgi:tetratricopeptide (TPR) repeat protein